MLELNQLIVHHGSVAALKGVSLNVGRGEVVTLIGANGAGKTTLLRTVSGLHRPTSGTIRIDGQLATSLSPEEIARLGVQHVPEGRRIFPELSVEENLSMGGFALRQGDALADRVEAMYDLFPDLRAHRRASGSSLSGGQQQMLAFARALIPQPRLLLLDEPSLGLAPALVQEVGRVISELRQAGQTILLVEQNANLALRLADRGYVLELGKITIEGPSEELRSRSLLAEAYLGRRGQTASHPPRS
jgi:branched-chain amino acid transport system ATP-binding protein